MYPIDNATDILLSSPTSSVTPSKTKESSATITDDVTITSTNTSTSIPTPTIDNFKIAYRTFHANEPDSQLSARIWVVESPYKQARAVFDFGIDTGFAADISWAHDGHRIATVQIVDDRYVLTIVDIDSLEFTEYSLDAYNSSNTYISTPQWSLEDEWLGFNIILLDDNDRVTSNIVNVNSGQIRELDYGSAFVAWSPVDPEYYLYIHQEYLGPALPDRPNLGKRTLHVSKLGEDSPIVSFTDLEQLIPRNLTAAPRWAQNQRG